MYTSASQILTYGPPVNFGLNTGPRPIPSQQQLAGRLRQISADPRPVAPLKEVIRPWNESILRDMGGALVLVRDEPLFRLGLTVYRDEREWRAMEAAALCISTSIRSNTRTLLGYGYSIKPGASKSTGAGLLADFGKMAMRQIECLEIVLQNTIKSRYYGWTPFQQIWTGEGPRFKGKPTWLIKQIAEQPAEHFAFTPELDLVYHALGWISPVLFKSDEDKLGWMIIRAGSTRSPYGRADLAYLWGAFQALTRFQEIYELGARNAITGIPVFKLGGTTGGSVPGPVDAAQSGKDVAATLSERLSEIELTMRFLREAGALALGRDIDFQNIVNIAFVDGWQAALAYLEERITISIEGQVLTSSTGTDGGGGSRALGDVHANTKVEGAKETARLLAPQLSEQVLQRVIRQNFPGEIDPDDLPMFRFRIEDRIDEGRLTVFINSGGKVDGLPVAEDWGIPLPEGTEEVILERQEGVSLADTLLRPSDNPPERETTEGGGPDDTARQTRGRPGPGGGQRPPAPGAAPAAGAPAPAADGTVDAGLATDQTMNGAQIQAAVGVVEDLRSKKIGPIAALEFLVAAGVPRERAQAIVNETQAQPPLPEAPDPPPPPPGGPTPPPPPPGGRTGGKAGRALPGSTDAALAATEDAAADLQGSEEDRIGGAWRSYLDSLKDAVAEAGGDASSPLASGRT